MKSIADEPARPLNSAPTSEAAPKGRAKSRLGKKLILVPLDPEMHLRLRHRPRRGPDGRGIRASSHSSLSF
jgi:hypothetical protein